MKSESAVRMSRRYINLIRVLNIRLNHFPAQEQKGLALVIRQKAYELCDHMVEAQKRYHKKTAITNLDISHEQLRMHLLVAREMGYFGHPQRKGKPKEELNQDRYESLTKLVDEFGSMIGGWRNKLIEEAKKKAEKKLLLQEQASVKREAS